MFSILVNGKNWIGFETVRVEVNFLQGSRTAHLTLPPKNFGTDYPIKANASIQIYLHSQIVLTGYIDAIQPSISMSGMSVMLSVRDKIGDLIDSTVNPKDHKSVTANITLKKFIEKSIKPLNTSIEVVVADSAKDVTVFEQKKDIAPDVGDSYFAYLTKYAHNKGCLLRSTGDGNLSIDQGPTGKLKTKLGIGVIKNCKIAIDMSNRFYKYTLYTQKNDGVQQQQQPDFNVAQSSNADVPTVSKYKDGVTISQWDDGTIEATVNDQGDDWGGTRESRALVFQSNTASDVDSARTEVKWEANYRRSNSMTYSCTVAGFTPPDDKGQIWEVGKLIDVKDVAYGLTETMMINKVVYNIDINSGSTADLSLVTQDAFTLNVTKPQKIKIDKKPEPQNFTATEKSADAFSTNLDKQFKSS